LQCNVPWLKIRRFRLKVKRNCLLATYSLSLSYYKEFNIIFISIYTHTHTHTCIHNKTTQNTLKTTEYNRRPFAIKEEHGFLVESSRDIKLLVCITLFSPSGIRIFFNEEKTFLVCRQDPWRITCVWYRWNLEMATSRRCTRDSLKWSKKSRRNWNSYGAEDSASLHFALRILAQPYEASCTFACQNSARILSTIQRDRQCTVFRWERTILYW